MNKPMPCELCGTPCPKHQWVESDGAVRDAWRVRCPHCGDFAVTSTVHSVLSNLPEAEASVLRGKLKALVREDLAPELISTDFLHRI